MLEAVTTAAAPISWSVIGVLGGICLTLGGGLIAFGRRQGGTDTRISRTEVDVRDLADAHKEHEDRFRANCEVLVEISTAQKHQAADLAEVKSDVKQLLKRMGEI